MSSGPEHYRKAEAILAHAATRFARHNGQSISAAEAMEMHASSANSIAAAQVHATLALAAATLAATHADAVPSGTHEDWWSVMGGAR